ncbi:MAG TPA: PAS domain S-box protein [Chthoniobacter sp.]|nr:PAS domain S-box protein [Chthoniobacter sp.]
MNESLAPAQLLSAIVDSSEDAIISKNLNSIVTSWNKSAERIFGFTADEMIGQSIARVFPPDRLEEETVIVHRISHGERVDHFETVRVRKDGKLIDVSLTISPVRDTDGKIVGASKIARDITEQKRASRRLADVHEELKRADRLKAEFLATLSHELRTPLTAILGWIQILKELPTPEELEQGIEVIERNVRLQSQLIEDLLDISRIESGKVALDVQRLNLVAIVSAAMQTVRPSADSKEIKLTSAFSDVDGVVMGDKNRLQQIVWNLLANAIKFTPRSGRIHVVIERVNSHLEISVTDSGQGIAPEFLQHVFDRFRQADSTTTRKHGGLGIGLTIAKHLTELHGGHLAVRSPGLGLGATFTVNLPLISAHPEAQHLATTQRNAEIDSNLRRGDLNDLRVLLVDDDPDSLAIVQRILQRNGATVRAANSMEAGLKAFEGFEPHVVLSDIGMPVHDGYELIKNLRALPGGKSIPAVALTALARSEDRARALKAGFQMHVAKPVDSHELVAVVQNLAALRTEAR